MSYVLFMTSPVFTDLVMLEQLLRDVIPASFLDQICRQHKVKVRQGIYSLAVVVWLMIFQRLNGKKTLSSTVQFLARQAAHWQRRPEFGKRVCEGRISTGTGGYCQGRLKMPTLVANSVCDHIFEQLQAQMREH